MSNQEIQEAIEAKKVEIQDLVAQSEQALEEGNLELSKELLEKAKTLQAEIDELQTQLTEDEEVVEDRSEEVKEESTEEDEQASDDEDKEDIKAQLEDLKTKNDNENGEKRDMTNVVETVVVDNKNEVRDAFAHYVQTGEKRAGITTESGAVIVPTEIAKEVVDYTNDVSALANLVQIKKVSNGQGEVAFFDGTSTPALTAVEELEENPMLGIQAIKKAPFKVKTYRGYFPVSQESIEDGIGAVELVKSILNESVVATQNKLILDILAKQKDNKLADLDAFKKLVNVDLAPKYRKQVVLSQSAYNTVDTFKDKDGRYLLQDSISSASGKQLFGMPVVVVEDELIGAGVGYVGDLAGAVGLVDRSRYDLQWTSYMQFAQCLMVAVRLDAIALNPNAVKKITLTDLVL